MPAPITMRFLAGLLAALLLGPSSSALAQTGSADVAVAAPWRSAQNQKDVLQFYDLRSSSRAWTDATAAQALDILESAEAEGLNPADYLFDGADLAPDQRDSAWDVKLTAAILRYARDVRSGRLSVTDVYRDSALPLATFDAPAELNAALKNRSFLRFAASLPPQRPEYDFLRTALARYREIAAQTRWPRIASARMDKALWARLEKEDAAMATESFSVAALEDALRRFQARSGLDVDGQLGPRTLAALNVTATARIRQIEANMERWRWMPPRPEQRYVEVNAADAMLAVMRNGQRVVSSRVVIGRANWQTPILATAIQAVILNPPWPIPGSIAGTELLPRLRKNKAYLAANDMIVREAPADDPHGLKIKWQTVKASPFPYAIEQRPSERNALGAFLMDMPNRFDVYLHDTPSQHLFERPERYFSHGCVRVEQIAALASFALLDNPEQDIAQRATLARDVSARLQLREPLPVYFVYWTAFQSEDGNIAFRRDVYGRDDLLLAALLKRRPQ